MYFGAALPFVIAVIAIVRLLVRNEQFPARASDRSATMRVRVTEIRDEAFGIKSFRLEAASSPVLPQASPGSHINVHLESGLIRQYSVCNFAEAPDHYRIAVKLEDMSRGGSEAMHALRVGDVVEINAPRNNFELIDGASKYLLFAGGIGITPLLAMVRALEGRGARYHLHYFTRSPEHAAFHTELSASKFAQKVSFHHGIEPDELRRLLVKLVGPGADGVHLYMCGPRPFMDAVARAAADWPSGAIHREYFGTDPNALAGPREEFEVKLARSGMSFVVPASASLLEILNRNGIEVASSCEEGVCGTCLTRVLDGDPDHRDSYLTGSERNEGDRILVCVSRARTAKLVLDL